MLPPLRNQLIGCLRAMKIIISIELKLWEVVAYLQCTCKVFFCSIRYSIATRKFFYQGRNVMKKKFLLATGMLFTSVGYASSYTGNCFDDGRIFAQEVAAPDYCYQPDLEEPTAMAATTVVDLCESPAEIRALEVGCRTEVIFAIRELYDLGECPRFKGAAGSTVQQFSIARRLCR